MADEKKRRGRPPLTDEQRELRRIENNKRQAERDKQNGYASQKKYHTSHPEKVKEWRRKQKEREKGTIYEPKIRLQIEYKPALEKLLADAGMSITTICLTALEEKYGVVLQKHLDNTDK